MKRGPNKVFNQMQPAASIRKLKFDELVGSLITVEQCHKLNLCKFSHWELTNQLNRNRLHAYSLFGLFVCLALIFLAFFSFINESKVLYQNLLEGILM